ncbi:hypothetical protein GCM10009826_26990 [Humibacillus xanthopallidus]
MKHRELLRRSWTCHLPRPRRRTRSVCPGVERRVVGQRIADSGASEDVPSIGPLSAGKLSAQMVTISRLGKQSAVAHKFIAG